MTAQTLSVFPAYLGGFDPNRIIADWNETQSPTLVITQDLDASVAYLVIGGEPEAADEVFEQHSTWPSKPVIWIDDGGSLSLYRCAKDFGEVRTATFEEVFPAAQIAREDLLNMLIAVERALDDASSVVDPGEEEERAYESELHGLRSLIEQLEHGAAMGENPASGRASSDDEAANVPAVYIELFHGRHHARQRLDDWGAPGPVFGPYVAVQTTYGAHVRLIKTDELPDVLVQSGGMLFYDGLYYGDWSVFHELTPELSARLQPFDQAKTVVQDTDSGETQYQIHSDGVGQPYVFEVTGDEQIEVLHVGESEAECAAWIVTQQSLGQFVKMIETDIGPTDDGMLGELVNTVVNMVEGGSDLSSAVYNAAQEMRDTLEDIQRAGRSSDDDEVDAPEDGDEGTEDAAEDEDAGDDVCDNCMSSGVECGQTCPECGATLCAECAEKSPEGLCSNCAAKAAAEENAEDLGLDDAVDVADEDSLEAGA